MANWSCTYLQHGLPSLPCEGRWLIFLRETSAQPRHYEICECCQSTSKVQAQVLQNLNVRGPCHLSVVWKNLEGVVVHSGCLHPQHAGYFATPRDYLAWYEKHGPLRKQSDAPRVGLLLYRKHVITQQPYIAQLIEMMEADGVLPIPIFINGIEAHTVVSLYGIAWEAIQARLGSCSFPYLPGVSKLTRWRAP